MKGVISMQTPTLLKMLILFDCDGIIEMGIEG